MLYRICTERMNDEAVEQALANHFPCFSIFYGVGYWRGKREKSMVIEIETDESEAWQVHAVAARIAAMNDQETILVQRLYSGPAFICPEKEKADG